MTTAVKSIGLGTAELQALDDATRILEVVSRLQTAAQGSVDLSLKISKGSQDLANAVTNAGQAGAQAGKESSQASNEYLESLKKINEQLEYEKTLMAVSQRDRKILLEQRKIEQEAKKKSETAGDQKDKIISEARKAQASVAERVRMEETQKAVNEMDEMFRKGFAATLSNGTDAWRTFTKGLGDSFKASVADQLYKAFVQPLVLPVIADMQGVIGSFSANYGFAQASGGQAATGGSAGLSGFSDWSTWGGKGSAWLLEKGNSFIADGWKSTGSSLVSLGDTVKSVDNWLKDIPGFNGGIGSAAGYLGSIYSLAQGQYGSAAGSALGTFILPGMGTMIGSVIGGALDTAFSSRGANHSGAAASSSGLANNTAALQVFGRASGDWYGDVTSRYNANVEKDLKATVGALAGVYQQLSSHAGTTARQIDVLGAYAVNGRYADEDSYGYGQIRDKQSGAILASFTDRELGTDSKKAWTAYVGKMGAMVVDQLKTVDLPGWMRDTLSKLGESPSIDQLGNAIVQINKAQAAMTQFGLALPQFAAQADAARTALVNASGGSEALAGRLGSFYNNFFTESERTTLATRLLSEELAKLGYAMPTSRDEYRAWVTTALESGEAGAKSAAGLLKLEGAVAGLVKASEAAANTVAQGTGPSQAQVQEAAQGAARLRSSLIGLEGSFKDGGLSRTYQAQDAALTVSSLLESVGRGQDVNVLVQKILGATTGDVEQYFREMWGLLDTTQARQQLVDVTGALMGLAKASGTLEKTASDAARGFAQSATAALAARNSAGGLIDRISGELGGDRAAYARQREQALWSGMATASYEQQIDLAGQLTDSVLSRMQLEKQSAEKLSGLHQGLRDSIEATRIGSLSPLTLGQQLKEAGDQFSAAVQKARAGDTQAAGEVAGLRQSYLQLAQRYYAASDGYAAIFQTSEDAVSGLAGQLQSEAQQQLAASQGTVSELQRLRDLAQAAYEQADRDYATSSSALKDQAALLAGMDGGIALVGDILKELPVELAAQLQPLLGGGVSDDALIATMRGAQDARPEMMLRDLLQLGMQSGASASQAVRASQRLYSDADVAVLLQAGRRNHPTWSLDQLASLGLSQYGITREQLERVAGGGLSGPLQSPPAGAQAPMPAPAAVDFSSFGRGVESMVSELKSVRTELTQARSENAQLMAMLAEVMQATGNGTAQQLRQAVREVALAGVTAR